MMGWNDGIGWHNGMGWGGWFGMGILMILFWGLVIWGIIALIRFTNASGPKASFEAPTHEATASSDEILAQRFARGEIDADEYGHRREVLRTPMRQAVSQTRESSKECRL